MTFKKCISLSAPSICSFPLQTAPSICTLPWHAHINYTHTQTHTQRHRHTFALPTDKDVPGYHRGCVCLVDQTATSGPLNDTLAGCGVTLGPIQSQTQQQICHIHSCYELLDITLSPRDDRLSAPASRWSISRLSPKPCPPARPPHFRPIKAEVQSFIFPHAQTAGLFISPVTKFCCTFGS